MLNVVGVNRIILSQGHTWIYCNARLLSCCSLILAYAERGCSLRTEEERRYEKEEIKEQKRQDDRDKEKIRLIECKQDSGVQKWSLFLYNSHWSIVLFGEKGMRIRTLSCTHVCSLCVSYVSINMNAISKQMGFTARLLDAPVFAQSGIVIISVVEDKKGYQVILESVFF